MSETNIYVSTKSQLIEIGALVCIAGVAIYNLQKYVNATQLVGASFAAILLIYFFSDAVHRLKYKNLPAISLRDDGMIVRNPISPEKKFINFTIINSLEKHAGKGGRFLYLNTINGQVIIRVDNLEIGYDELFKMISDRISFSSQKTATT